MMDRSSASAYVNAKASGMLTKSFVGTRASKLFSARSLPELWSLLFGTEVPSVPEVMLAQKIEQKALDNFIGQYQRLLDSYTYPDDVAVALLRFYDFDNLKQIGAALANREMQMPVLADIGKYSFLNYTRWPDIAAITKHTPLAWYNKVPEIADQQKLDNRLDLQYMRLVWSSVCELPSEEREPVENFILHDLSMKNIIWALRLKVYYGMKADSIIPQLAFADKGAGAADIFAGQAMKILDKDISAWSDWSDWRYADLLNPHEEGVVWTIDPRWIEQASRKKQNNEAMMKIHQYPLTAMVPVTWFRIKQNELDCIRTATEGLRLNVDVSQVMEFAGIGKLK
jgi:vacuolar-type H+-ATPase subunit C/Vma6